MRSYPSIATALLLVLTIGTAASGEPTMLLAEQNPVEVSTFTLSFTDFGIDSTSSIIDTNYGLRTSTRWTRRTGRRSGRSRPEAESMARRS